MENQNLQIHKNLKTSLRLLDQTVCRDEIKKSIVLVMERLDMEIKNIENVAFDISKEFNYATIPDISEALRKGSLGHYDKTYKLNTQELCIWIRKHLKLNKPKLL
jgi:hypothetical protein